MVATIKRDPPGTFAEALSLVQRSHHAVWLLIQIAVRWLLYAFARKADRLNHPSRALEYFANFLERKLARESPTSGRP